MVSVSTPPPTAEYTAFVEPAVVQTFNSPDWVLNINCPNTPLPGSAPRFSIAADCR